MSARLDVYVDEFSNILTRVRVWKQYDILNRCSGFFKLGVISIASKFHLTLPVIDHTVIITGVFMPLRQQRRQ